MEPDDKTKTPVLLPDQSCVDFGSPAMDDLRFALAVVSLHAEGLNSSDEKRACERAIKTLSSMTDETF